MRAATDVGKKVTWAAKGGTVLQRLIQLGSSLGIPIGFVVKDGALCKTQAPQGYTEVELSKVMDDTLLGSGYGWHLEDGVLEVRPSGQVPQIEARILKAKLATFSGINTTIQGLGIVLAGRVRAILSPGQGYAGDVIASLDAENIPAFTLRDVTVEEVANSIVSRGSKGVWILYQTTPADARHVSIKSLGYKDDSIILRDAACIVDAQ